MPRIKITEVSEIMSVDPARRGKKDLSISYSVDEARFYFVTAPLEEMLTPEGKIDVEKVDEFLRGIERERMKLIGREIEV